MDQTLIGSLQRGGFEHPPKVPPKPVVEYNSPYSDEFQGIVSKLDQLRSEEYNLISGCVFKDPKLEDTRLSVIQTFWKAQAMLDLGFTTVFSAISLMTRIHQKNSPAGMPENARRYASLDKLIYEEHGSGFMNVSWIWITGYIGFRLALKMEERPEVTFRVLNPRSAVLYRLFAPMRSFLSDASARLELLTVEQNVAACFDNKLDSATLPELVDAVHMLCGSRSRLPPVDRSESATSFSSLLRYLAALSTMASYSFHEGESGEAKTNPNPNIKFFHAGHVLGGLVNLAARIENHQPESPKYSPWCEGLAELTGLVNPQVEVQHITRPLSHILRDPGPHIRSLIDAVNKEQKFFGEWPSLQWN